MKAFFSFTMKAFFIPNRYSTRTFWAINQSLVLVPFSSQEKFSKRRISYWQVARLWSF